MAGLMEDQIILNFSISNLVTIINYILPKGSKQSRTFQRHYNNILTLTMVYYRFVRQ